MTHDAISLFFDSVSSFSDSENEYDALTEQQLSTLKSVSDSPHVGVYVMDFGKQCFPYVGTASLFLCDYLPEEVRTAGYRHYFRVVHPDDLPIIAKIHRVVLKFFHAPDTKIHDIDRIAFNFRILHSKEYLMVYHQVIPWIIDGKVRAAVCVVTDSARKITGNLYAYYKSDRSVCRRYFFESDKWLLQKTITLTPRENDILKWAKQDKSIKETAAILGVTERTIKNERDMLFKKLEVQTIMGAITVASNLRLLYV